MNLSFRSKLLTLVATAGFALAALVVSSSIIAGRVEKQIDDIRRHYLPKVGLRPQLEAQFERMQRGFQDAVAASDTEKLARMVDLKKEFLQQLAASSGAVDPGLAASLEQAIEEFHTTAMALSRRLIAGETGEGLIIQMTEMQTRQKRVAELVDAVTVLDKAELTNAFASTAEFQRIGSRLRLAVGLAASSWSSCCRCGSAATCCGAWPSSPPASAASARETSAQPFRWSAATSWAIWPGRRTRWPTACSASSPSGATSIS